jgi:hypothetical protein
MPTVNTGLSEVIGSWKIIAISRPRMLRISSADSLSSSRPLKITSPSSTRPGGLGMMPMIDFMATDLPEPLSPTMAIDWPSSSEKEIPLTAWTIPSSV